MNSRKLFLKILLLIILTLPSSATYAQDEIDTLLTSNHRQLTVGDPVRLTLTVTHPTGYRIIIPELPRRWGEYEILSQGQLTTVANSQNTEFTRQIIEVTLFAPGEFATPPLSITVRTNTNEIFEIEVSPVSLIVESVLTQSDLALRDIRPQIDLSVPPLWPWLVAALIIVGVIAWVVYRRWKLKRQLALAAALLIDPRTPYEKARDEFARIERLNLPAQARLKEHYTLVADCVRQYLEDEYQVPGLDRTTGELRQMLKLSPLEHQHTQPLIELLRESDLVKFAKYVPKMTNAQQLVDLGREIVRSVRPAPIVIPLDMEQVKPVAERVA